MLSWEHSLPTDVARVRVPDSEVFLPVPGFPLHKILYRVEPLLSGQYQSPETIVYIITENKTRIKRSTLLNGRSHLLAVPIRVFILFLSLFSGHQEETFGFLKNTAFSRQLLAKLWNFLKNRLSMYNSCHKPVYQGLC